MAKDQQYLKKQSKKTPDQQKPHSTKQPLKEKAGHTSIIDSQQQKMLANNWWNSERIKTIKLYAKIRIQHTLRGDLRWIKKESHLVSGYLKGFITLSCLLLFSFLFIVGFSLGPPHQADQASAAYSPQFGQKQAILLWQQDKEGAQSADIVKIKSLFKDQTRVFLAVEYDEGVVHFEGRIPEFSRIDVKREQNTLFVTINANNNTAIRDCQYSGSNSLTSKLITVSNFQVIDEMYDASTVVDSIKVDLTPSLSASLVGDVKDCLTRAQSKAAEYSTKPIQLRLSVSALRYGPQSLVGESQPEELQGLITYFKLCPCSEDPNIGSVDSDWIGKLIADKKDGELVDLVGVFNIIPSQSIKQFSAEQVTLNNLETVLGSTNATYNGHLKELVSINGIDKTTLINTYNDQQEDIRIEAQQAAAKLAYKPGPKKSATAGGSSNRPNATNSGASNTSAASNTCINSDDSLGQLYCLINEYRNGNGVGGLSLDGAMQQAAANHNNWMVETEKFSHTGANGSRFSDRCAEVSASCSNEILARSSYTSASQCMAAWKGSSTHNGALLNPGFNALGGAISGGYCTVVLR